MWGAGLIPEGNAIPQCCDVSRHPHYGRRSSLVGQTLEWTLISCETYFMELYIFLFC